jgi:DNA-binding transcriptional ArsR family regulator
MPKNKLFRAYKLFFGTLTSKDRLLIINSLRHKEKTVNDLQKELKLEQTRVSHNLRRLRNCGFVKVKQIGKYRLYSLNKKTILPLMRIIDKHMEEYCFKIISNNGGKK